MTNPIDGLSELKTIYDTQKSEKDEYLKEKLDSLANKLFNLEKTKFEIETNLEELSAMIKETEQEIRDVWLPHIAAAEKASVVLGNLELKTSPKLTVKVDDKESALEWMIANGYKEVMKWEMNTGTLKKIASEKYTQDSNMTVPGLSYSYYQIINVHPKKGK